MKPRLYTGDDLRAYDKAILEVIAEARGVDVTASGKGGKVVVDDLVAAVLADQDRAGLNPAVLAEPVEPVFKRYLVTGTADVFEQPPGTAFEWVLRREQEEMLIEGGALQVISDATGPDEAKAAIVALDPPADAGTIPTENGDTASHG